MTNVTAIELNAILRSDYHAFAQKCFAELNSGSPWKDNWHLDAISHALEGVIRGTTTRLIINMPPRSLKSLLGAIALPAYLLGRNPAKKIICASYSQELAEKHAGDFRRVIDADWYANLFGQQSLLKNAGNEVVTAAGGFRLATSVGGTLTGRGGDLIIVDDPLNASEASSKTTRDRTNDWFSQTLVSRLDNKQTGAIVIIMQRLHDDDLTGYVLERGRWDVLSLPAVTSESRTVTLLNGRSHAWKAGEPLHPSREPLHVLDGLQEGTGKLRLQRPISSGPSARHGQYAQARMGEDVRKGDDRPFNPVNTTKRYARIERMKGKMRAKGHKVIEVSSETGFDTLMERLR